MRRILITMSIAAALFASCEQDDEKLAPFRDDQTIKFGKVETRAEVTDANQILEFGVFAEMNLGADDTEEAVQYINLLSNERVYRANAISDWSYDNKRYWVNDRTFHFFAVYPYMQGQVSATTLTQNGKQYDGYKVSFNNPTTTNAGDMVDLMTAYKTEVTKVTNDNPDGHPEYVALKFAHALAKVNINLAKDNNNKDNKIEITSISLGGFMKNGTLSTSRIQEYTDNWDFYGVSNNTNIYNIDSKEITTGGVPVMENLILIPQTIALEQIRVVINYKYYAKSDDTEAQKTSTVRAYLPVGKWEAGKEYTYNIKLAAEDNVIKIPTPTAALWGVAQPGGTIIIQ